MNELTIGGFAVSVILSLLLRMVYNTVEIANRWKPWIAVGLGMALSLAAMWYTLEMFSVKIAMNYVAQGFMTGASAVGFYEMTQKKEKT